jgi:hypothetical protein
MQSAAVFAFVLLLAHNTKAAVRARIAFAQ